MAEGKVTIYGREFRTKGRLNPWSMMKMAQAERRGDNEEAMARFADLIEHAVHPDDREALDVHLSEQEEVSLMGLQEALGRVIASAIPQAGQEGEDADPTEAPSSGRSTATPTPDTSPDDSPWGDSFLPVAPTP